MNGWSEMFMTVTPNYVVSLHVSISYATMCEELQLDVSHVRSLFLILSDEGNRCSIGRRII